MAWTIVNFGRFRGKNMTLPQILFTDPDWFFYLMEQGAFERREALTEEAWDIYEKAKRIRIPTKPGERLVAVYYLQPLINKLARVEVVPQDQMRHEGGSPSYRRGVFDMAFPRQIASYDKTGGRILIWDLKDYLFGSPYYRMTKKRAEAFFDNPDNFLL